jgi:hypothetical protein
MANIAAPKSRPMTDQAFMTDFLPTQMQKSLTTIAERWLPTNVPPLIPEWYLRTDGPLFAVRRIEPYH